MQHDNYSHYRRPDIYYHWERQLLEARSQGRQAVQRLQQQIYQQCREQEKILMTLPINPRNPSLQAIAHVAVARQTARDYLIAFMQLSGKFEPIKKPR